MQIPSEQHICYITLPLSLEQSVWNTLRTYIYQLPSSYNKFHKECYKALLRYFFTEKSFLAQESYSSQLAGIIPDFTYATGLKKLKGELQLKCDNFEVESLTGQQILGNLIKIVNRMTSDNLIANNHQLSEEAISTKTVEFRERKDGNDTFITIIKGSLTVELRESVYKKMINDYQGDKITGNIISDIIRVALRYQLISDDDLDTYHWAVRPTAIAAFNEKFHNAKVRQAEISQTKPIDYKSALLRKSSSDSYVGIAHECFASPLNHSTLIPSYSSLFFDSDAPFGSKGNIFLYLSQVSGIVMANPPFLEEVQDRFVELFLQGLVESDKTRTVFGGILIYPRWNDAKGNIMIKESPYLITSAIPSSISDKKKRESIFGFMSYNTGKEFSMGQHWQDAIDKVEFFLLLNETAQQVYGSPKDFFVF